MTSTSASPARLVVVAPVDRKFTADCWSASSHSSPSLLNTCSINSVSLKPESPHPLFIPSHTILNNGHAINGSPMTMTFVDGTSGVDDVSGVNVADCSANSGDSGAKDSKNTSSTSSSSMAVLDRFTNDRYDDDDQDDNEHADMPMIDDEDEQHDDNVVEPLILAKRRKSKRRRWILSRKPKCISRTQRIIFPTIPSTNKPRQNSKRKHLINGLDTEASDDQDAPSKAGPSTTPSSSSLEPAVHASVFLPHTCQWPSTTDATDETSPTPMCLQSEMTKHLLPHLNDLLSVYTNDVYRWTLDDVAKFVRIIPNSGGVVAADKLADKFKEELIDGEALLLLTQNDLIKQMQIKLGPALKIYSSVLYIKHQRFKR